MLGSMSITHWMVVICVAFLLFGGRNKISDLMGDVGRGFGQLKKGLTESHEVDTEIKRLNDEIKHG
jgi:sec-independent protein translocase protein TatA